MKLFLVSNCTHILRKETKVFFLDAVKGDFICCRGRRFCRKRRFTNPINSERQEFVIFLSLERKYKVQKEKQERDLTPHAIVGTRSDRRSRVMYGLRRRPCR